MSSVSPAGLSGLASLASDAPSPQGPPARVREAAQQFEALLIGQILRASHDSEGGWLGGGNSSGACAAGYAEEQLAVSIAQQGGFGLSKLITQGLEQQASGQSGKA